MTVAGLLLARAQDDRPGLRSGDDIWTWRQVIRECAVRAAWMRSSGARHFGVLSDNVPELIFLLGGAALSGSVVVGLNTTRGPVELAGDAERADCDLIIAEPAYADLARELHGQVMVTDDPAYLAALNEHQDAEIPETGGIAEETLLMLIFTSGTSGSPRAVRITHRKVVIPGENLAGRLLGPDDVVYCPMPLFHSGAIMAAYAPALAAGATLVLRRRFSASGLLPDLRRYGVTYLQYVGKALSYALASDERPDDKDNPLKIAFGNEAAPLEQKAFGERFGCFVIDAYGSTETAIAVSPDPMDPPGALGKLTEGVKILDPETGTECPPARFDSGGRIENAAEAIGELVNTKDLGLFDGYYNDGEADAERLKQGMYWSGDFGYADENGYVFFAGRSIDRLRVDGENFGAAQVERVLAEFPGLRQLAVYGVPDVAAGDQVMAAILGDFDPEAFAAFWAGRRDISPKWVPRYVRLATGQLPATASNKILKRELAAEGWRAADPVWWRPSRDLSYRLMTPDDTAALRSEFERSGRLNLLEGSG
ncbi:MAG: AMP-dependent synthetase and ligase [Actinomycetia bacterium]|nr:AMP-dependent synthetase and ligase [Actinomycetes bacterium]